LTARPAPVRLRPAGPDDEPFLRGLSAEIRAMEFAALGLPADALERLLAMQHEAQERAYRSTYPHARADVVLVEGARVGRIVVDRGGATVHLVDIAIHPDHQGRGIGTALLSALIEESLRSGRSMTLTVLRTSRALALYRRLGFTETGGDDVYLALERPPGPLS
jgi:ribosomal protein S18 acetylase RimI-like enzyme